MKKIEEKHHGVISLKDIYFKEISFLQDKDEKEEKEKDTDISLKTEVINPSKENFTIKLSIEIIDKGSANMRLSLIGIFEVDGYTQYDETTVQALLKRNTVAILFPFLRSQVTLLTAQPGMLPIVLPTININAFFDEQEIEK